MAGIALIVTAVAAALLAALSLQPRGLGALVLTAYLAFVADVLATVLALSPFGEVTRGGMAVFQAVLLAAAAGVWWLRGRWLPALGAARRGLRELWADPAAVLFVAVVLAALAYEFVLVLTGKPNDYDGLAYHLVRVAAWTQHGGYFWVPNSPDDRINEFQPIAEQELLFTFVALGKGLLFALPQYVAELAILAAVYTAARRLGYAVTAAVGASALLASFGLVALEATTAQNDLVAASFPVAGAALLLGSARSEHVLAGAAAGLALGAKLTTALVFPILLWLALLRGRRATIAAIAGALAAFAALGMWGFVLNLVHTGQILGHGGGRTETEASPAYPASLVTGLDVLYTMMDLSALSNHLIAVLEYTGITAAVVVVIAALVRRVRPGHALLDGARVLIPWLSPLIVIGGGGVLAWIARRLGYPIRGPGGVVGPLTRTVNSGVSAFGPLGAVSLFGVSVLTLVASLRRGRDVRRLALACSLPLFLVLLALQSKWNPFLPRFFLVPATLTAPLLAQLLRGRIAAASYLAVAATVLFLTLSRDQGKPLTSAFGHPWQLSEVQALELVQPEDAPMLAAYSRLVPAGACVGALLGRNEPAYLLFGPRLGHEVVFLPEQEAAAGLDAVEAAYRAGVSYVVVSANAPAPPAGGQPSLLGEFGAARWRLRSLGGYWTLATAPHPVGACIG